MDILSVAALLQTGNQTCRVAEQLLLLLLEAFRIRILRRPGSLLVFLVQLLNITLDLSL